jgi:hypothetical protein
MPTMPPLVSTSSTRRLRASPKACPLSHGVCGQGTRRRLMRMAVMVMSVMRFPRAAGWAAYLAAGSARIAGRAAKLQTDSPAVFILDNS